MGYFYKLAILITGCSYIFLSRKKSQDKFNEVKDLLNKANGRERIFIAIGFLWFVLANLLYFSCLNEIVDPVPIWQVFWHSLTFGFDFARLYNSEIVGDYYDVGHFYVPPRVIGGEYRLIGHFMLINLPITITWGFDNLCTWVISGFKDEQK